MRIIQGLDGFPADLAYPVLTIGNFDGVHIAHRRILSETVAIARRNQGTAVAMTFWPHPAQFFTPDRKLQYLADQPTKQDLIRQAGIDLLVTVPFDRDFSRIEAEDFVQRVLLEIIGAREIVVGFNFSFGRGKAGNANFLKEEAARAGSHAHIIGAFEMGGVDVVSSTRIRSLVREGDVETAARFLGRGYSVRGEVIHGAHRGAGLGFPTANVHPGNQIIPAKGVYVASVVLGGEAHEAVVNVGVNPTFGGDTLSIEAHLLEFDGDLYGETIEVRFIRRIRPEMPFPSIERLIEQIGRDVETAKAYFKEEPGEA